MPKWCLSILLWCLIYKYRTKMWLAFTLSLPFPPVASWEGSKRLMTSTALPMPMLTHLAFVLQNDEIFVTKKGGIRR